MATEIERNGIYKATRVRRGVNNVGPWELVVTKEEGRGKKEIPIYVMNNPTKIEEGDQFKMDEISKVSIKAKRDQSGAWTKSETYVFGFISKVEPEFNEEPYEGFGDSYDLDLDLFS